MRAKPPGSDNVLGLFAEGALPEPTPSERRPRLTAGKDGGMASARDHADQAWLDAATDAVVHLARDQEEFTTDDVWMRIPAGTKTHEPRAMGPVMRACAGRGLIGKTDRTVNSTRPDCNQRPVAIWKSLVFRPDGD